MFITFRCTFFFLIVHAVSLHGAARLRVGSFLFYLVLFLGCIYDRMKLVVWCRVGFTLGSTGLLFFPFLFSIVCARFANDLLPSTTFFCFSFGLGGTFFMFWEYAIDDGI
ncbi:hypothetical protein HDV57DRAFT_92409 [Trichoderma longibrachiatum]